MKIHIYILLIICIISMLGACQSKRGYNSGKYTIRGWNLLSNNKENNLKKFDLAVYGATPAGIIAAVTAAKHGLSVILIEPMSVIGGMYSSGLNTAESEHMIDDAITGRARDFYTELGERYYDSAYFQTFGNGRGLNFKKGDPAFFFESKHAVALFEDMLKNAGVELIRKAYVNELEKEQGEIASILLNSGRQIDADYFIDCSYEGDLMAMAGVSYMYGRESISEYNESLAGLRLIDDTLKCRTIDENGNLLPYFNRYDTLIPGSGDERVMNYNFRPTLTKNKDNFITVTRPKDYDSTDFNFLADYLEENPETHIWKLIGIYARGSGKYEFNNQQNSLVSLGMFGANTGYSDGDIETRQRIYNEHKSWTLGFLYFLGHDQRVPGNLQQEMLDYGFAADEFVENDNFPVYLYIREGRRMKGEEIHTQKDVFQDREKLESVLLGSHWVDCHHVQRIALSDSTFTNEGRIWEIVLLPFEISYRVMTPKKEECTNLLVPVCASFSHVAFCTYRLESTWMQAGHAAGLASVLAIKNGIPVQDIEVSKLQTMLQEEGMIINANRIKKYNDYEYLKTSKKDGDQYKRMYEYYNVNVDRF